MACIVTEIFGLKKRLLQKGKVNRCNATMEISYNRKINFCKYDRKSYVLPHINMTIAHKNLILLKLEFRHVAFSQLTQGRNKTQRLEMLVQCTVKG